MFNYDLSDKPITKSKQTLINFGLSEYDIEKLCQEKLKMLDQTIDPKKVSLFRTFDKKKENRIILDQIKTIDSRRLIEHIDVLSENLFEIIRKSIRSF
jgi:hypothetical protein